MMAIEYGSGKAFRFIKIFHIVCIIAVLLWADALYRMPLTDGVSWGVGLSHSVLKTLTIILIILAIYGLASGYFLYRVIIKAKKVNPMPLNNKIFPFYKNINHAERVALSAYFMLTMMGVAAAAFGLVAGMLGDGWQITVPIFVVAEIALIIKFPTQKRWQQILAKITQSSNAQW
jgi:hypothetical protein